MSREKLIELMDTVRVSWPRDWPRDDKDVKVLSRLYTAALCDIPDKDYGVVVVALVQRCKFRPTPAEVIETWHIVTNWVEPDRKRIPGTPEYRAYRAQLAAEAEETDGTNNS